MKMKTFTATFSTGDVVTRTSHHDYITAVALVHKETGKLKNVKFSTKPAPAADWEGVSYPIQTLGTSSAQRSKWRKENEARRADWNVEIVTLTQ